MGKKRGFFAELQHQNQVAARTREQAARAAARDHAKAVRQAEQAKRQAERARTQTARAAEAERKMAMQEARRLHVEAMEADAASLNAQLTSDYDEIDSMLGSTLGVDDYVDLERLRVLPEFPPFDRQDLEAPTPAPPPIVGPNEPRYVEPPSPQGLGGMLGGKKRHAEAVSRAQAVFRAEHAAWQEAMHQLPALQLRQMQAYQQHEGQRQAQLAEARRQHEAVCTNLQHEASAANQQLDALIADLANGEEAAVQEYVSIVLGNSVYPDPFPVEHDFEFNSELHELTLHVTVPGPDHLPSTKAYKYNKSSDEITTTALPQKELKDRYAGAVQQVALRSIHEVFEADRQGLVQTISLTLGTNSIDPATGQAKETLLVALAADRESFMTFDLAQVVPLATLQHMGATISRNPFGLVPIDAKGVRSPR